MTATVHIETALAALRAYRRDMSMPGQLDTAEARESYRLVSDARAVLTDALRIALRGAAPVSLPPCPCGASAEQHAYYDGCPSLHPRGLGG